MSTSLQDQLLLKLTNLSKIVVNNEIYIPAFSNETRTKIVSEVNDDIKFELIINRKGHRNKNIFSLVFMSPNFENKIMMRLDYSGTSHAGIETPHVHIFDEAHDFGKRAVLLEELSEIQINNYSDSLDWFLMTNRVKKNKLQISQQLV